MNTLTAERIERMQHKLTAALTPSELTIQDDSLYAKQQLGLRFHVDSADLIEKDAPTVGNLE